VPPIGDGAVTDAGTAARWGLTDWAVALAPRYARHLGRPAVSRLIPFSATG